MDGLFTEMRYFKLNLGQARNCINFVWIGDASLEDCWANSVSNELLV